MAVTDRHSWVRLKRHKAMCQRCGTGRTHVADADARGGWRTEWSTPDGEVLWQYVGTPPCAVGPKTAERLAKLPALLEKIATAQAAQNGATE